MKIIAISDTHNHNIEAILRNKSADVLVIAGDITGSGSYGELAKFEMQLQGVRDQFEEILWIGGNHDFGLCDYPGLALEIADRTKTKYIQRTLATVKGINFWGEASVPGLPNMAFPYKSDYLFNTAPEGIDVLVTHGPPKGILDKAPKYGNEENTVSYGCRILRHAIFTQIKPKVHIFGHIHHSHGFRSKGGIRFYNVSICDEQYRATNEAMEIKI